MRTSSNSPRHAAWPLLALALAACFAAAETVSPGLPALDQVYVHPAPVAVEDFELTDQRGARRSFASLRGRPALVFFGFSHCPDVCPSALARLRVLHAARDGVLKVAQVVMISVDGERDSPAALKAYLEPLSPDFIGLTGDPQQVARIAAQFSTFFVKEPAGKDGGYNIGHSGQVYAIDRQGRLRAAFGNASIEDMATITALLIEEI
ncbi:MAG: SCO family protein [Steroidobacteraceae bacterium]